MKSIRQYSQNLSILIIEDNQGDFILIEDHLLEKFKNIDIVHFTNFENSYDYLQNPDQKVSLILLDLHLPDLKGMDLINKFLSYNFQIPIVILTGYSDLDLAKKSLQTGIHDYLIKDEINPEILYKTIIFALNRSDFINQIEEEKNNYENLFNFNPQPTWLLEAESLQILNANISAQMNYGFNLDLFQKMSFLQLHPDEEVQLVKLKLSSKEVETSKNHFTHFLADGKKINVDIYFKEIETVSGKRLIVQSNDISETLNHIGTIEIQNKKLKEIAWTQSHVVRAPIARILAIINLIEEEQLQNTDEISFLLKQLKLSTVEMDNVVREIVSETNRFRSE
ncbi:response regulator [Psychroflexus aestuariivivens]|uniref:response regulator n=1 Tax=Psychroflexus aestuariivivens TaxID=1795040 RepID=UPI000FDC95B7|nr:response regulator [Psychroflexus aestuariivivens]